MRFLEALILCLFVTQVSCKANPKNEEFHEDSDESSGFVHKNENPAKSPFTANLMKSVDKAIAENFEENILTSWLRSDDGQKAVVNAADMLTNYVNRNFGYPDEENEEDYSMTNLISDFFKSQQKSKKVKNSPNQKRRRARREAA